MKPAEDKKNKAELKTGKSKPGWLERFTRGAKKDEVTEGDNFKKDKETIVDYHAKIKAETAKREGVAQYTSVRGNDEASTVKKEVKGGREAILNKFVASPKKWQAPKLVTTNLIKGEVTTFVSWRKNIIIMIVSIGLAFFILAGLFAGLIFWEKQASAQGERLATEIKLIELRIGQAEKEVKEIDVFQEKLSLVESLIAGHIYWTNVFKFFESSILSGVYITSDFSSDLSGQFSFPIEGKSYADVTNFVNVLRAKKEIRSADVKSASTGPAGDGVTGSIVNFIIEFELDTGIFTK